MLSLHAAHATCDHALCCCCCGRSVPSNKNTLHLKSKHLYIFRHAILSDNFQFFSSLCNFFTVDNFSYFHWNWYLVEMETREVIKFDHLYENAGIGEKFELIEDWLRHEYAAQFGRDVDLCFSHSSASLNKQTNGVDCGFFMLTGILLALDNMGSTDYSTWMIQCR